MRITEDNVAVWLRNPRPWALLPQTLSIIMDVARGELAIPEAARRGTERAELRTPARAPEGGALAVLSLYGLITPRGTDWDRMCGGSGGLVEFQGALSNLVEDDEVGAILLDIDSPGGVVDLVPETAAMIRDARQAKPIYAVANAMAASAAYWLASQADEVIVTPSGLVGSIGVYIAHDDYSGALEQAGVVRTLVSAGRYKTEGNPWEPLTDEARANLQEMTDDIYGMFVRDVAAGRGTSEAAVRAGYGEGRVLTAQRAVTAGLADRVEAIDQTVQRVLGGTAGIGEARAAAEPPPALAAEPPAAAEASDPRPAKEPEEPADPGDLPDSEPEDPAGAEPTEAGADEQDPVAAAAALDLQLS